MLGQIRQEFSERFKVSSAVVRGQYNLEITDVRLTDEGFYECTDRAGLGESVKARLSVTPKPTHQQTTGSNVFSINSKYI